VVDKVWDIRNIRGRIVLMQIYCEKREKCKKKENLSLGRPVSSTNSFRGCYNRIQVKRNNDQLELDPAIQCLQKDFGELKSRQGTTRTKEGGAYR